MKLFNVRQCVKENYGCPSLVLNRDAAVKKARQVIVVSLRESWSCKRNSEMLHLGSHVGTIDSHVLGCFPDGPHMVPMVAERRSLAGCLADIFRGLLMRCLGSQGVACWFT